MIRHSAFFCFILVSTAFVSLTTSQKKTKCEDDPTVDCNSFEDDCATEKLIPLLTKSCPVTCNLCPSTDTIETPTANSTTVEPPTANSTTVEPPTANSTTVERLTVNPNCYDSGTNCKNWAKNGFCTNSFYKCTDRLNYCAKTCGLCTAGACKDSN